MSEGQAGQDVSCVGRLRQELDRERVKYEEVIGKYAALVEKHEALGLEYNALKSSCEQHALQLRRIVDDLHRTFDEFQLLLSE